MALLSGSMRRAESAAQAGRRRLWPPGVGDLRCGQVPRSGPEGGQEACKTAMKKGEGSTSGRHDYTTAVESRGLWTKVGETASALRRKQKGL